jgi:cell division transport system ATP-binding protein
MITCYNLSLEYTPGKPVLHDVTLKIPRGSFHFLTGASGAGKSSLLNVLALTIKPTEGTLSLFGHDIMKTRRDDLPPLRRQIGSVVQDFALLDHLTVEENIALPQKIMGVPHKEIMQKVTELLEWIDLAEYRHDKPNILSGGQKQRVAIARAVINNPPLLLADEPTGNLDPALSKRFMYLFETLNKLGSTVIFATHDQTLVNAFSYPVLHLENGEVDVTR